MVPQAAQAPPLAPNVSKGGPDLASILGFLGGKMDKRVPVSGPIQPGMMRETVTQPSYFTQLANRMDPQREMMEQYLKMMQSQQPQISKILMNMGIR